MQKINFKLLIALHAVVAFLLLSWLYPPTHLLWHRLDMGLFRVLNPMFLSSSFGKTFWAIANHRYMDWFHDVVMLSFFIVYIIKAPKLLRSRRIAKLIFAVCLIASTITYVNRKLFPRYLNIKRSSPSLIDPTAIRLSKEVSWLHVKDYSKSSFPADHATTAILFCSLIFFMMGRKAGLIAVPYTIFFCLPRLINGAHYLTDVLMGSLCISLLVTAWVFGTPIGEWCIGLLSKIHTKVKRNASI